jgi:hypothetical protein
MGNSPFRMSKSIGSLNPLFWLRQPRKDLNGAIVFFRYCIIEWGPKMWQEPLLYAQSHLKRKNLL